MSTQGLALMDVAHIVSKLKMYPYFDIANYVLMCTMVREDSPPTQGQDAPAFSRRHPFSSWVSSMLMCFASVILANAFVGDSPATPFLNNRDLVTATAVWYFVNYSPFDLVFKFTNLVPIYIFIYCLKEIQRVHKIHHGVSDAIKVYPHAYALVIAIGVLKGAGYYYMRTIERLVRGNWIPIKNEFLYPSLATKVSLLASIFFILDHEGLVHLPHQQLNLAIIASFIFLRLIYLTLDVHNPFRLLENIACTILFGGTIDALKRAISTEPTTRSESNSSLKNLGEKNKEE